MPNKNKKTGKKCDEMIAIASFNPGSVFIFSTISSFKASALNDDISGAVKCLISRCMEDVNKLLRNFLSLC